ncbi:type II CAAX prenyl endopeptidase Rce1 family protein [Nguyenibacter sp. L1]|uniref:CPBP family glutamic-type intramembrane protease n=1 Tax=Nguyenibacter sp. L1 TaxID=3049350 RepID=UPI0038D08C9D
MYVSAEFLITVINILGVNDIGLGLVPYRRSPLSNGIVNFFIAFSMCFVDPLIETILFQFLLYKIIKNKYNYIIISSFIFGISHNYSLLYILIMFLFGSIYSTTFYFRAETRNKPLITVYLMHSIWNILVFIKTFLVDI